MAAPIGQIEFLVKFDSMQTEFQKVLEDALKKADVGADKIDMSKLSRKMDDIEHYVRMINVDLTGAYLQFQSVGRGKIEEFTSEKALKRWVDRIKSKPEALQLFGIREGEDVDKRLEEYGNFFLQGAASLYSRALANPTFYERYKQKILKADIFYKMLKGSSEWITTGLTNFMNSIVTERQFEDAIVKQFEDLDITVLRQKRMFLVTKTAKAGERIALKTYEEIEEKLRELGMGEQELAVLWGKGVVKTGEARKLMEQFAKTYTIEKGAKIPGGIIKTLAAVLEEGTIWQTMGRHIIPDVGVIVSEKTKESIEELMLKYGFSRDEIVNEMEERLTKDGGAFVKIFQLKIRGGLADYFDEISKGAPVSTAMLSLLSRPQLAGGVTTGGLTPGEIVPFDPRREAQVRVEYLKEYFGLGNIPTLETETEQTHFLADKIAEGINKMILAVSEGNLKVAADLTEIFETAATIITKPADE